MGPEDIFIATAWGVWAIHDFLLYQGRESSEFLKEHLYPKLSHQSYEFTSETNVSSCAPKEETDKRSA